jgi:hypothetical protein
MVGIAGRMTLLEEKCLLRQKEVARKCNLLPWKDDMMLNRARITYGAFDSVLVKIMK